MKNLFTILTIFLLLNSNCFAVTHATKTEEIKVSKTVLPKLEITFFDGKKFNLAQQKNQMTIIVFWAKWCGICKRELKILDKIYKDKKSRGLEIVGISIDDKKNFEDVKKIADKLSFGNGFYSDAKKISFEIPKSIPTKYFLDKNQQIIKVIRGEIDEDKIEKVITENNFN
ncbi:MAG: TlpA family protein disulfide reductase [Alphaproteobacteria bacterium]|nr:TlpA family protein disulfide reductase [Alphaproteobacteria bacterium]